MVSEENKNNLAKINKKDKPKVPRQLSLSKLNKSREQLKVQV